MKEKIQVKDLIRIGIFTAIYYIIFFTSAMVGYIPILFIMLPIFIPLITGIPFMLFLSKTKKFGMVTIMGILLGFLMFATGHTWVPVLTGAVFGLLSDLIFKAGRYKSMKNTIIGSGVFGIWMVGAMLPMWLMRESYFEHIRVNMGDEYTNQVLALTPNWLAVAVVVVAFVAGIAGAFLGKAVLRKHFEKAGIY